jgi:putative PIN family toxin of toxin-antitoxin system
MNVVIDTSVWISALISKDGASREIIRLALLEKIYPQISTSLFLEYEDVTKREDIKRLSPLKEEEIDELFYAFLSVCKFQEIFYLWRPNLRDRDDDFIIELAVASNSKVVITNNIKDLKAGELIFNFKIQTPKEFLKGFNDEYFNN